MQYRKKGTGDINFNGTKTSQEGIWYFPQNGIIVDLYNTYDLVFYYRSREKSE